MGRDPRRLIDLTWEEFRDRAISHIVLVPLGAVEQHGPHLPLDTDMVVPESLALAVAERLPVIVAPGFASGYKSQPDTGGGERFPGTTSFDGATFIGCVRDIVRQLINQGVRSVALLNGNYENTYFGMFWGARYGVLPDAIAQRWFFQDVAILTRSRRWSAAH